MERTSSSLADSSARDALLDFTAAVEASRAQLQRDSQKLTQLQEMLGSAKSDAKRVCDDVRGAMRRAESLRLELARGEQLLQIRQQEHDRLRDRLDAHRAARVAVDESTEKLEDEANAVMEQYADAASAVQRAMTDALSIDPTALSRTLELRRTELQAAEQRLQRLDSQARALCGSAVDGSSACAEAGGERDVHVSQESLAAARDLTIQQRRERQCVLDALTHQRNQARATLQALCQRVSDRERALLAVRMDYNTVMGMAGPTTLRCRRCTGMLLEVPESGHDG